MKHRALVLGLDGVTFDVVDPLLARGRMPVLADLLRRGTRARLRSTCPPVSAPAWVTFLTGRQPGRHGVFNFQNPDPTRYSGFSEALVNSSFFRGTTLLDHLGKGGEVRTLAYRVPMTFPPWEIRNTVVVSGPPVPDRRRAYTKPDGVMPEIEPAAHLSYDEQFAARAACDVRTLDAANRFELDVLERVAGRYLADGTDLVIAYTGIPDGLQHGFWAFHDPSAPLHQPDASVELRTMIERWHVEIDAVIGRLIEQVDERTAVVVLSDHGGGPAPHRLVNLNACFLEAGLLRRQGGGRAQVATRMSRLVDRARVDVPARGWLKRRLPAQARRWLRGLRHATGAIAWEQTRAYAVPIHFPITGVWVNLAGRQPRGVVPPAEYEEVRRAVVDAVANLTDPLTGAPIVIGVWPREAVYSGPHVENAPDLIVQTTAGYHGGFGVDTLVTDVPVHALRMVNGSHTTEGIFVATGGPFRRGVVLDAPSVADVLPTVLHVLGAPLPADLDGRVIEDALEPQWAAANPVQTTPVDAASPEAPTRLSPDEETEMQKHLRALGYVD